MTSLTWLSGLLVFGGMLLIGLVRTVRMRQRSQPIQDARWTEMLAELKGRLHLQRAVELREHEHSVVPLTWGVLRPVVMVPKLAREWAEPMQRAVLLHELAHVQRGDVACQVLGRLACVLYWFHPLAWFALRQLRQEREQACDDAVIHCGEKASDYAEQLLAVARMCLAPRGLSLGVAMAEGSSLERRVISLFDSARSHRPLTRRMALVAALLGAAVLGGLAPIQPTASTADHIQDHPAFNSAYEANVTIFTERKLNGEGSTESGLQGAAAIRGMGSGLVIDAAGVIVTANHVVDGASKVRVQLHDGTELPASVIGQDAVHDIAVLRIHSSRPLTVMPEEHQQPLKLSDEVSVIDHSNGKLNRVSPGVVTYLGRKVEISPTQQYSDLIQTDVPLEPGDSGGALLNGEGKAIGINIAIRAGSQKIGFAIPIQVARKVFVGLMSPVISGPSAQEQLELLKPVFGEAKRGIQLGLAVGSLQRTFPDGGRIPLWLFYRNAGESELTINLSQDFMNHPPTVTDASGNRVQVNFVMHWMFIPPLTITLKPGEVWCIATTGLNLGEPIPSINPVAGKYRMTYPQGIWSPELEERLETNGQLTGQVIKSPTWSEQLETGTIEFEIAPGKDGIPEARVLEMADAGSTPNAAAEKSSSVNASQQVSGIVVDSQGRAVSGAIVWCDIGQDKAAQQPITARVETNAQGEFRFTVPQLSPDFGQGHFQHAAWAWKPGHGIGVGVVVASTRLPKNPEARLSLPETSTVALQVVDEKGQPLAGAEVSPERVLASQVPGMPQDGPFSMMAIPPNELRGIATRKTDAEGRVTLDLVPHRFLSSVQVNSTSHGEQTFSYYGDVLNLNAVTSVEGELSNHQAGVRLTLLTSQTRSQTERRGPREIINAHVQVVTDTQGRFTVPIFPVGECSIASEELNGPQFLSANSLKGELAAGVVNKLTLDVIAGIPVKGRVVVRGENKGVANASIYIWTFANLETGHIAQTLCQTDENGVYSSYTLPGHYVASDLASVGDDPTLIHPHMSSFPPSLQRPPQLAADAKEAVIPEIVVDRGKQWSGTLVDEHENPINEAYLMPLQNGKRLAPPFPTLQGGKFSFTLVSGATPEAWHLIVDPADPNPRTLPLQVLKKEPLVLQTRRDLLSKKASAPDQPQESWNPIEQYSGGFSPEEIEESRIANEGVLDVLKKAGLSEAEITRFNTVGPNDLTGIVLDAATQKPIVGADIKLMSVGMRSKITTDAHGVFRVEGLTLPAEITEAFAEQGIPIIGSVQKAGYAPRAILQILGKAGYVVLLDSQTCFEGVITDPSGQPVAGATVKSEWQTPLGFNGEEFPVPLSSSTTTNADGSYRLPVGSSLPNSGGGNTWHNEGHDLQVIAPGIGSARKTEEYIAPRTQTKLSLRLTPPIHFQAKITDSLTGAPAPGFVLYTSSPPYIQGRSDSEGNLVIRDLLPGDVHFSTGDGEATPYGNDDGWEGQEYYYRNNRYGRWWSPDAKPNQGWSGLGLHVPKDNTLQENHGALRFKLVPDMPIQTITVERTATISGRVVDPEGRPVSGAKITPIFDGRTVGQHEATSQEDGRYVLSVLASKNVAYHLMVQDETSQTWANGVSADLTTNPAQAIENSDLQLTRPGRVTGRVMRQGRPVANFPVRTVDCEHREWVYFGPSTRTKADGSFELTRVRPGKHFLRAGDLRWPIDKDSGPVIEVVAGQTVADQVLEANPQPDPQETVSLVPAPTSARADTESTTTSPLQGEIAGGDLSQANGKIEISGTVPANEPTAAAGKAIRGQIINESKQGIPQAEVLITVDVDSNDRSKTRVIASGFTDAKGNYSISIPESELGQRQIAAIWRRAEGYAAARGNDYQTLDSLLQEPLNHQPLVTTPGTEIVIVDPAGKPVPSARVEIGKVKVVGGVPYPLPEDWRPDFVRETDSEGRVSFPFVHPGSLDMVTVTPAGQSTRIEYTGNYFLNYEAKKESPHFTLATIPTGKIAGRLVPAAGITLPRDITLTLISHLDAVVERAPGIHGVAEAKIDSEGRFEVNDLPVGRVFIPKFLSDEQPLRAQVPAKIMVSAGQTTQLDIPVAQGVHVTGRVEKSDTTDGAANYKFSVIYGPSIAYDSADSSWVKQDVETDANGHYELELPPGPINLRLGSRVEGYRDATHWLPEDNRGRWGPRYEIPHQAEFELPAIQLVKDMPVSGQLVDQNKQPLLGKDDWTIFGYPQVPGLSDFETMNSVAGVRTDTNGKFTGSYPETYPPVRWQASKRVWKTKFDFEDIKFRAHVIQKEPLILEVDTTKPINEEE